MPKETSFIFILLFLIYCFNKPVGSKTQIFFPKNNKLRYNTLKCKQIIVIVYVVKIMNTFSCQYAGVLSVLKFYRIYVDTDFLCFKALVKLQGFQYHFLSTVLLMYRIWRELSIFQYLWLFSYCFLKCCFNGLSGWWKWSMDLKRKLWWI